jgi:two-component system, chemotaxis family, CheB/CheR fusion protein
MARTRSRKRATRKRTRKTFASRKGGALRRKPPARRAGEDRIARLDEQLAAARKRMRAAARQHATEQRAMQGHIEDLGAWNKDLDALFDTIQIAIVVVWPDRRIRRFTPLARSLFNLVEADIGRPIGEIRPALRSGDLQGLVAETIEESSRREQELQDAQGRWYALRAQPYRTASGETGAILALVDIEAQKQTEASLDRQARLLEQTDETLRRRIQELAAADRAKNEFLALVAHELRNPLAPLRNAVEILRSPARGEVDVGKVEDLIERQVTRMARLVDDLLDAARISRGQVQLEREPVDLRLALERAIESTRSLFAERGQTVALSFPSGPLPIMGDAGRLEQVFANVLTNAAKYTGEGGHVSVDVDVSDDADGPEACVRIRDDGIGIAAEMLPHVFELFSQADRSPTRTAGGLGIGLSLVRKLVELHGGTVSASSEGLGKGSEFAVRLPLRKRAAPARTVRASRGA